MIWPDSFGHLCCWQQCDHHMTLIALSMVPFCFARSRWLIHGETWHFGHVMPLLESHDTNNIINNNSAFASLRRSKWDVKWFLVIWHCWHWHQHHVMPTALSGTPLYSLGQDGWKNVQHKIFWSCNAMMLVSLSHDANSVTIVTIQFLRLRWSKWDTTWLFWSCDANSTSIMWCQWNHANSIINVTTAFLRSKQLKWGVIYILVMWHYWCSLQHYMMPTALSMTLLHTWGQDDQNEMQYNLYLVMWSNNVVYI